MNESSPRDPHWLRERLRGLGVDPAELRIVRSALRPVIERGDPWQADPSDLEVALLLDPLLTVSADSELEPPAARGRVIAVTDVEEDPVGRVQTAVLLARAAAHRGLRVLLVDADLRHVGLSRWLPDREVDAEGLVDVLEYGASVHAVLRDGPIANVGLLSVGSYRPDASDLFDDRALGRLVVQLRAAADVVIVVVPAWLGSARFHPLLVHADAVAVSVHLDHELATPLDDLLRYLHGLNIAIAGLVTYAGPDASEQHVDALLREADPWRVPEDVEDVAGPESATDALSGARAPFTEPTSGLVVPAADREAESAPRGFRRRPVDEAEKSSPALRAGLIVVVVALLAFVGWWGLTQREHPPVEPSPLAQRPSASVPPREASQTGVEDEATPAPTAVESIPSDAAEDSSASTATPGAIDSTGPAGEGAPRASAPVVDAAPADAVRDEAPTEPATDGSSAVADALARAVGNGYALHLFSFPDSTEALTVLPRLRREGWQPVVVGADVPDKGRWYRVLVGRFESRAAAIAAIEEAKRRAGTNWAGVVRVP